ncbi:MAG: hypothetical protein Q7S76_02330 [bacterium]|nr:hypothetical protein [bacterium]
MSTRKQNPDLGSLPSFSIDTPREKCGFCLIPQTGTTDCFQRMHGDLPHVLRIPGMPASWTALQDVVPLAEQGGHVMIMPNQHWISFASVDDQRGLAKSTQSVVSGLRKFFPHPIFFFEHGPGFVEGKQVACGGCHMDHAHGHLLLLPEGTTLEPIKRHTEYVLGLCGWTDIPEKRIESTTIFTKNDRTTGTKPYIHMGMIINNDTHSYTYIQTSVDDAVEAQLLRRVIADAVYHRPERSYWHWRDITSNFADDERITQIQKDVIMFRNLTGY